LLWFLIASASVIAAIGLACLYCFRECFFSSKNRDQDPYAVLEGPQYATVADRIRACTARMDEVEYEWVSTVSHDGLPLWGRYYHVRDNAPVKLIFHGYRSPALRDSAGGWFLARKLGFNVLAVDQRAHARSGGTVITFGILERQDCLSWVRYINGRFGSETPVILCGLSMGAATVLMASGLKLPNNVAAIMADSPYSAPADIIRKVCRDRHLPDALAYPFIRLAARIYGNFDLTETTAVASVQHAKVPILLLHGEDDRFVPCEMSRIIYNACASPCQLQIFPAAGHGLCYITDPKRYEEVCTKFLWSIPSLKPYMQNNDFIEKELNEHG
jgi:fermentation-respiration switch protein FrsA (DUF1100 family)